MSDFSYDELELEHMDEFCLEYKSFLIDDEPEYDVFGFDNVGSVNFIADVVSACDTSTVSLDPKPRSHSLRYVILDPDESLPVVITSDLYQDQEKKLFDLLRKNKEILGWTLREIKCISPTVV